MSEQHRAKKDGEDKNAKNQRMREQTPDERQNVDRKDVRQPAADEFDKTLDQDSKSTQRGDSNKVK